LATSQMVHERRALAADIGQLLMNFFQVLARLLTRGEAWAVSLALVAGILACLLTGKLAQCGWPGWLALALMAWRFRAMRVAAAACAGFFLASQQAQDRLSQRLAPEQDAARVQLQGRIDSLVSSEPGRIRFRFAVLDPPPGIPETILLNWYRAELWPRAGETWSLYAKLRTPRGFSNPGGFDYERWLFRQGIGATGYVVSGSRLELQAVGLSSWLLSARDSLARQLAGQVPAGVQRELVFALVLGHRQGLDDSQRQVLAVTGTSHLLAISGLHIGLVSGIIYWLVRVVAGLLWPAASRRTEWLAWSCSLAAGLFYACLAGLALPTRRALLMLGLFALYRLFRLPLGGWQAWCLALGILCALDPSAVLGQDLWLSFGAVACIGLVIRGHRYSGAARIASWARVQLAITVGLAPLLAVAYGQISILAPVVNLLLVPWFGLVVLPPLLLGVVLLPAWPVLAETVIQLQGQHLLLLWRGLEALSVLGAWRMANPGVLSLTLAVLGSALYLCPPGLPGRRLGLVCWLALLLPAQRAPENGEFELTVLDVGQGLASVIRTANHVLVYDSGPAYMGRSTAVITVIPFLQFHGVQRIDGLITSHADLDHAGGADIVRQTMNPRWEVSGDALGAGVPCHNATQWWWDGVHFQILHPEPGSGERGNAASCVLLVRAQRGSVLLTGDIPESVERTMVDRHPCLAVDVVVAPHHGSASSSSAFLVKATSPVKVIFAAGYGNRWGFPRKSVVEHWAGVGAKGLHTGEIGAVTVHFRRSGEATVRLERMHNSALWSLAPVSSGSDVQYDSGSFPTRDVRRICSKLSDPADG
jgi:competence protein ComEC